MAAVGASSTAKRLALAYILFKLIAALIALILFPVTIPLLVRASNTIDGVTLLAGYHTAYNVVGVLVLLPVINGFTRLVERILPERGSPLTRCLDPAALVTPIATEEAVRRTVALSLGTMCKSLASVLAAGGPGAPVGPKKNGVSVAEAAGALHKAQEFLSEVSGPPQSEDEQVRLTSTLHALDHASRLTETVDEDAEFGASSGGSAEGAPPRCAGRRCVVQPRSPLKSPLCRPLQVMLLQSDPEGKRTRHSIQGKKLVQPGSQPRKTLPDWNTARKHLANCGKAIAARR